MNTVSQPLDEQRDADVFPDVVFTVQRLRYGGYAVMVQDDIDYPSRHVCDFRTEYEARQWIRENAPKHVRATAPLRRSA